MNIEAGAFEVTRRGASGGPVDVAFTTRVEGGKTIADLTFSGTFVFGGSLVDGNYELLVLGAKVKTPAVQNWMEIPTERLEATIPWEQVRSISSIVILDDTNGDRNISLVEFQ